MTHDSDIPVYGIDLGTTNSCIAMLSPGRGEPQVIDIGSEKILPSVVYFKAPETVVIGRIAKNHAVAEPDLVCSHIKRKMALESSTERVSTYHGTDYAPEDISALILRKLVDTALEEDGHEPGQRARVVVTVPAYFGTIGKNATKQAGVLANLDVLYVAPEPVAAALAYIDGRMTDNTSTFLVYDLGGGTFDVAVVTVDGQRAEVKKADGERVLGGINWDEAIVDWARQEIAAAGHELPEDDPHLNQDLALKAEAAKIDLSTEGMDSVMITLDHAGQTHQVELTRDTFEKTTSHLLETTIEKTKSVIDGAKSAGVEQIDRVVCVGGSTRMLAVKEALMKATGLQVVIFQPDQAIAKGAAILANLIETQKFNVDMTGDTDVGDSEGRLVTMLTPKGLGILAYNPAKDRDVVEYLVPKETELPASVTKIYGTDEENQTTIHVKVYEERGEPSQEASENTLLHETAITLPGGLRKGAPIHVTYSVDDAGILHVFLKEPDSGQNWEVSLDKLDQATDDDILRLKPAREAVI
ncbi:Hsp70 family protein [Cognatiyoonia sp. IB215446]|uniref:Hsp70 family protein n=1 Tax=Cognatiyoonia sp. IB215446 TaxID=3097355 RepID=UPI002A15BB1F|nr:Hsp70 family protein [Cognatiyoonia sp. IB215446]MDX8349408.1 Hsp70 family protein [Cognatiyoonia sp. IB215446]